MEETKTSPESRATSVQFQLGCIFLSAGILALLIIGRVHDFYTKDESPQLRPITPDQVLHFGGTPAIVRVGFYLANFSEFNVLSNDFTFNGTLWFEFDPSTTSLDSVKKIFFEKGELLSISEPTTKFIGDRLLVSFDIRGKKKDNLNYAFFPFSDHSFHLVIANRASPAEIIFESSYSDLILSKSVQSVAGWNAVAKHVETGYSASTLQDDEANKQMMYHPRVLFTIDYSLVSYRQLLTILLPLILIFYLAIFSLSMDPVTQSRSAITLASGAVTALLAYRFVIENLSPKAGYFMLSDYIFFLFLTACCVLFLVNTRTLELSRRAKYIITIIVHVLVLCAMIYFLNFYTR